ncbi:MAG: DNA polymerase beta domain-containing protein [Parcubacteria group bacterium Gr01-1014_29]|nr:MAG: DNA polymerase beta domain-containing protein [Parcubacteria group bacterium Gr01-1014_29]
MKLEHYPSEKLKKEILASIAKHLSIENYRVFFFGSRVTGKNTERSDIDVGIEGPHAIPGHILMDIQDDLSELRMLYKIEVVDFAAVGEKFRSVVGSDREFITVH